MIVDKDKLRKRLERNFSPGLVDDILVSLIKEGLPIKFALSNLDIKIGEDVSINFLNRKGEKPTENDILTTDMWIAKISNIDSMQIKSINIPTLTYDNRDIITIDVEIYPFKIKNIFKNDNIEDNNMLKIIQKNIRGK